MELHLTVNLDGADMDGILYGPTAAADIDRHDVRTAVNAVTFLSTGGIRDVNGATIGSWEVTE